MKDSAPVPGGGAHRIAEHVGLLETHAVHEGGHVVRQIGLGDGALDVGGAAMALEELSARFES